MQPKPKSHPIPPTAPHPFHTNLVEPNRKDSEEGTKFRPHGWADTHTMGMRYLMGRNRQGLMDRRRLTSWV